MLVTFIQKSVWSLQHYQTVTMTSALQWGDRQTDGEASAERTTVTHLRKEKETQGETLKGTV